MNKAPLVIATISLAKNPEEEQTLRISLEALAALDVPVCITDGGSPEEFVSFLKRIPHFTVLSAKGLWPQAKSSMAEAEKQGAQTILYTEPDKLSFFQQHLPRILEERRTTNETGVTLLSRSASGFASFPPFQQMTERAINTCCGEVIGLETDYCYGPFFFNSRLIPFLDFLPDNCGWGWRPALFATAYRKGQSVNAHTGDFFCPPHQQMDDAAERIYRMKQLAQNIDGLVAATAAPL